MHHEKSANHHQINPSTFFRNQWLITFLVRKKIHCALIYFAIHTETKIIDELNRGTFIIKFSSYIALIRPIFYLTGCFKMITPTRWIWMMFLSLDIVKFDQRSSSNSFVNSWAFVNFGTPISAGVIVSYSVIIDVWRENRLSKCGNVVYTVV